MIYLLWPGDDRCGDLFTDAAVLGAMVRVEAAWFEALHGYGVAWPDTSDDLRDLVGAADVAGIARSSETGSSAMPNKQNPASTPSNARSPARTPIWAPPT